MKNSKEAKTDAALPAYCNPPNPCPVGYSAEDGCLEQFENTAGFSRQFQASQDCMCDSEHMFDCPATSGRDLHSPGTGNDLTDTDLDRIMEQIQVITFIHIIHCIRSLISNVCSMLQTGITSSM
jgi:hypothetical protein